MTTTVEYESAGKLAEKMLKVLKERGWIRNDIEDGEGKVCILGALGVAYDGNPQSGYAACDHARYGDNQSVRQLVEHVRTWATENTSYSYAGDNPAIALYSFNDTYAGDVTAVELALEYVIEREKAPAGKTAQSERSGA